MTPQPLLQRFQLYHFSVAEKAEQVMKKQVEVEVEVGDGEAVGVEVPMVVCEFLQEPKQRGLNLDSGLEDQAAEAVN